MMLAELSSIFYILYGLLVNLPHLSPLQYLDDKARIKDAVKLGKVWS